MIRSLTCDFCGDVILTEEDIPFVKVDDSTIPAGCLRLDITIRRNNAWERCDICDECKNKIYALKVK